MSCRPETLLLSAYDIATKAGDKTLSHASTPSGFSGHVNLCGISRAPAIFAERVNTTGNFCHFSLCYPFGIISHFSAFFAFFLFFGN